MGSIATDNRPLPVSPTVVCTTYGPTRRRHERAGPGSTGDGFGAADATTPRLRCTTRVRLTSSWTPAHPLPPRAVEKSRIVNTHSRTVHSNDSKALGGRFQCHPLGAAFVVYLTLGASNPRVTVSIRSV